MTVNCRRLLLLLVMVVLVVVVVVVVLLLLLLVVLVVTTQRLDERIGGALPPLALHRRQDAAVDRRLDDLLADEFSHAAEQDR